jgi:hypothetical protein
MCIYKKIPVRTSQSKEIFKKVDVVKVKNRAERKIPQSKPLKINFGRPVRSGGFSNDFVWKRNKKQDG